ncbi:MAG: M48 family metallopeptidase [Rhodoferax sp.]|uniref:M48 family metallopeptidase n=1 Tax=Rhodoferax sp. TaxID=50421 RepID=UPI0032678E85
MGASVTWRGWLLGATLLAAPLAWAREGVEVSGNSAFSKLVSAESVEQTARTQYQQTLQQAQQQQALAPANHPQLLRLRRIAARIIPFAADWNPRAKDWQWQVNLVGSNQINAWCMPGGKIAFYTGILDTLKLTDDEVAAVMGHEIAHALREHARERMGKSMATNVGANLLSQLLGAGDLGNTVIGGGAQLLSLQFSRSDETEADLVGLELAARAGFDPRAGITLWQKMAAQNKGAPPQWLSTHPAGSNRIAEMQKNLPRVLPLYERAKKS